MSEQNQGPAAAVVSPRLKITEIFLSLQGESRSVGWPTVFVRLTGCPLRCQYCDTAYAFHGGQWHSLDEIVNQVACHGVKHVCVTGGEPLAQKNCLPLLKRLCDEEYIVSLETSGAIDISRVDRRVHRVIDVKTPGSGEVERNLPGNLDFIERDDQVKFVLCSRSDYEWAVSFVKEHSLSDRCEVLFSPSHGQLSDTTLANWVVEDKLPVRFQMQLHKQLWDDQPGR